MGLNPWDVRMTPAIPPLTEGMLLCVRLIVYDHTLLWVRLTHMPPFRDDQKCFPLFFDTQLSAHLPKYAPIGLPSRSVRCPGRPHSPLSPPSRVFRRDFRHFWGPSSVRNAQIGLWSQSVCPLCCLGSPIRPSVRYNPLFLGISAVRPVRLTHSGLSTQSKYTIDAIELLGVALWYAPWDAAHVHLPPLSFKRSTVRGFGLGTTDGIGYERAWHAQKKAGHAPPCGEHIRPEWVLFVEETILPGDEGGSLLILVDLIEVSGNEVPDTTTNDVDGCMILEFYSCKL